MTATAVMLLMSITADAGPPPQRTVRIRVPVLGQPNGPSENAAISDDGRFVAFDSRATNLAPPVQSGVIPDPSLANVYLYEQEGGGIRLLSPGLGSTLADGSSSDPAVANGGRVVAFVSSASNLVPGDTNAHSEIYVHDRLAGGTSLVSATPAGLPGNGDSSAPAISPDGRYVSFATTATNLLRGIVTTRPSVVLRDLLTATTRLVSVSPTGHLQNASVARGFTQLSDVSAGGRFVAFDSDATNLVRHDRNRHTDVFVRDMTRRRTLRASLATTNQEADNDSFAPTITPDGRFVTFESFATNLTPSQPSGPNVFVRDLRRNTTVMADVSTQGQPRGDEHTGKLLQRPSISDDGATMAFASSATNLVADDTNGVQDVFIRRLTPAPVTVASHGVGLLGGHIVVTFISRDLQAGPLLCRLDRRPVALCPLGPTELPTLRGGKHVLRAYAGGPGSVYAARPTVVRINIRNGRAHVKVTNPGAALGLG